jgi:serine/threonine protein kinase
VVGIEDFDIMSVIGRGAFGKVFLCTKKGEPNVPLAMKAIRKDLILEEGMLNAILAEDSILKKAAGHNMLVTTKYSF